MALTRRILSGMGLTEEQVNAIIEAHTETVNGLKEKLEAAEEKTSKLEGVQKQLDDLKAKSDENADYKAKYEGALKDLEKSRGEFDAYKAEQTAKETKSAKEKAVRAYFESKGITGSNLTIAMRGAKDETAGIELDGDTIKNTKALDALVGGEFKGLVVTRTTQGATTANPPANNGGHDTLTKEDIMSIKNTAERQQKIAENPELFGIAKS